MDDEKEDEKIEEIISDVASGREEISENLLYKIYLLEKALAPMERREGITGNLRNILEKHIDTDDS